MGFGVCALAGALIATTAAVDPAAAAPPHNNYDADNGVVPRGQYVNVADVWAGSIALPDIEVRGDVMAVAYYDAGNGNMTIAARRIGSSTWSRKSLATPYPRPRDGHRSISIAFDPQGRLHLSGNMHENRLVYFRTDNIVDEPSDVLTMTPKTMIGDSKESMVTYPVFLTDSDGEFTFLYRNGRTNAGDYYVNKWNGSSWSRTNGGEPVLRGYTGDRALRTGSYWSIHRYQGEYHIVLKLKPENSGLCRADLYRANGTVQCRLVYLKTRDFETFQTAKGTNVSLPMTFTSLKKQGMVDRAGAGGLFWVQLGFDPTGKPMIVYSKSDHTYYKGSHIQFRYQVAAARFNGNAWKRKNLTSWPTYYSGIPVVNIGFSGPHTDATGTHMFVKAGTTANPSAGWSKVNYRKLTSTPMPGGFVPPTTAPCNNSNIKGRFPVDLQYPNYVDPMSGAKMGLWLSTPIGASLRTASPDPGFTSVDDAGDYYYLVLETIDRGASENDGEQIDPEENWPPATKLRLWRTQCVKP